MDIKHGPKKLKQNNQEQSSVEPTKDIGSTDVQNGFEDNHQHAIETPKKWKWKKHIFITIFSLLLLALISLVIVFGWYIYQLQPVSSEEAAQNFTIETGSSSVTIGDKLEESGIIRSSTAFQFYLRSQGNSNSLQAGTYLLTPSLSTKEVAEVLVGGKTAMRQITIPPGLRLDQIVSLLKEKGFKEADIESALKTENPYKKGASLEGYLFPETYTFDLDASAQEVVDASLAEFDKQLTDEVRAGISEQGLSINGAVILASIVQQESSNADTQKQIAQVFLKRLDEDISLGADPTFRYAASLSGGIESPSIDHPYNTRIYKGLTPGPIGNFNLSALEAVANPADTDYLYFVAGDDGITRFSNTQAEHEALIKKYCIELCKL